MRQSLIMRLSPTPVHFIIKELASVFIVFHTYRTDMPFDPPAQNTLMH